MSGNFNNSTEQCIERFEERIKIQEHNISNSPNESIQHQINCFKETVEILKTHEEAIIKAFAKNKADEIQIGNSELPQRDINFDNWIILVEICSLYSEISQRWWEIQKNKEHLNELVSRISSPTEELAND